jgi:sortase A
MRGWKKSHAVEALLLMVGIVCLAWFSFSVVDAEVYQSYANYELEAARAGTRPTIAGYLKHLVLGARLANDRERHEEQAKKDGAPAPRSLEPGALVGRIDIPRIKVSTAVREGADDKTLKLAAGHLPSTALPGARGNVGIAAHRDTFFRNLRGIREGDTIRMTTEWGVYEYKVDSLKIVRPENVEVLHATPTPSLTLVTCYPFNYVGSAPKRFIVRATQVNPAGEDGPKRTVYSGLGKSTSSPREVSKAIRSRTPAAGHTKAGD